MDFTPKRPRRQDAIHLEKSTVAEKPRRISLTRGVQPHSEEQDFADFTKRTSLGKASQGAATAPTTALEGDFFGIPDQTPPASPAQPSAEQGEVADMMLGDEQDGQDVAKKDSDLETVVITSVENGVLEYRLGNEVYRVKDLAAFQGLINKTTSEAKFQTPPRPAPAAKRSVAELRRQQRARARATREEPPMVAATKSEQDAGETEFWDIPPPSPEPSIGDAKVGREEHAGTQVDLGEAKASQTAGAALFHGRKALPAEVRAWNVAKGL
mmetsp:Transcript_261/g.568  ORF Transcript_261/g.568 Transcript_261/m.568 type:complete len:269 (+) Transcript_261:145-951(+)